MSLTAGRYIIKSVNTQTYLGRQPSSRAIDIATLSLKQAGLSQAFYVKPASDHPGQYYIQPPGGSHRVHLDVVQGELKAVTYQPASAWILEPQSSSGSDTYTIREGVNNFFWSADGTPGNLIKVVNTANAVPRSTLFVIEAVQIDDD